MRNVKEARIKTAGRNVNNLRYADDTTLTVEGKEEIKSLLMKVKERGEWKSWLRMQYSKTKIMASGPITSWQIDGEKRKWWQILFSWVPKSMLTVIAAMKLKLC